MIDKGLTYAYAEGGPVASEGPNQLGRPEDYKDYQTFLKTLVKNPPEDLKNLKIRNPFKNISLRIKRAQALWDQATENGLVSARPAGKDSFGLELVSSARDLSPPEQVTPPPVQPVTPPPEQVAPPPEQVAPPPEQGVPPPWLHYDPPSWYEPPPTEKTPPPEQVAPPPEQVAPPSYQPPLLPQQSAEDTRAAGYNATMERFANSPFVRPEGIGSLQLGKMKL